MNQHLRHQPIPFIDTAAQRQRLGKSLDDAVARVLAHCQFLGGPEVIQLESELARVGIQEDEPWWALIRLTMSSRCRTCMLQIQDVLGLGSEARMNTPGTVGPQNWSWRLEDGALTPDLAAHLRAATAAANRVPKS